MRSVAVLLLGTYTLAAADGSPAEQLAQYGKSQIDSVAPSIVALGVALLVLTLVVGIMAYIRSRGLPK